MMEKKAILKPDKIEANHLGETDTFWSWQYMERMKTHCKFNQNMYMYGWVPLLFTSNYHNIVNLLYNTK